MVCFDDFPPEIICAVLEHLDLGSLTSTAIVATSLQNPSERQMYHTVTFNFRTAGRQMGFLRTVSSSERRARHVGLLALHEINEGEEKVVTLRNLERAMKLMVNLKNLSIKGNTYIRHAHLESVTFSLAHLSLELLMPFRSAISEYEVILPILKAHPELRGISFLHAASWLPTPRFAALEERHSEEAAHPSAVLCPHLEYVETDSKSLVKSLLVGRCIKHLVFGRRGGREAERQWGSSSTFPQFSHLETLVLLDYSQTVLCKSLPIAATGHFAPLTRLSIWVGAKAPCPLVHSYTPDPLILAITRIQTLESLTLSGDGAWCSGQSEQDDMIRFLYKSCPKLKEAFVQRYQINMHSLYGVNGMRVGMVNDTHSHYGVNGTLVGMVDSSVAFRGAYKHAMMFAHESSAM